MDYGVLIWLVWKFYFWKIDKFSDFYILTDAFHLEVQVKFFDIYGRKLNTSDVGVTCNGAGSFFLKSSKG